MSSQEKNDASDAPSSSANVELSDLDNLSFPEDIDWSSTLILRCDPEAGPYSLLDVTSGLHNVVRRNDVHNLSPTSLNHVFTISFKSERSTENFVRYLKGRESKGLTVKNRHCIVSRIPDKTVTMHVRCIPIDVDTRHILEVLQPYGKVVKTTLVQNERNGWFHVYTGERKFQILLNDGVDVNALPYSISVKEMYGAVFVKERNPQCLDCYHKGHKGNSCKYKGCIFNSES